jgi:molybdenum cofactor cytidylyltransferase
MSGVSAIILAAGRGSRFGDAPKLLADLDGKPLVRRVAEAALASRTAPVLAVLGHRATEVGAALAGLPVAIVPNPAYAEGLSTSLRAGFAALPAGAEGAVILLGDMPRIGPALIDGLLAAWAGSREISAVVPTHAGRRGNPVLLARTLAPAVAALTGDAGAGPLLRARTDVLQWPADDPAVLEDVDTPAALAGLRDQRPSRFPSARQRSEQ